jgi:hypothetical protein
MREELQKVRDWANAKLATGDEPPWAWFQYMKLRENLDQILAGMAAATTEYLQQSEPHQEKRFQLVDANYRPCNAQSHPPDADPQLPM